MYSFTREYIHKIIPTRNIWRFKWNPWETSDFHCVGCTNVNHSIWNKRYLCCTISTSGIPSTIVDGLNLLDTQSLYGKLFSKYNTPSIIDRVIRPVYILNYVVCHVTIARSLIVHIDRSIIPTGSFLHICAVNKELRTFLIVNLTLSASYPVHPCALLLVGARGCTG